MKITKILVYQVDVPLTSPQPLRDLTMSSLDCTVVEVQTDSGITGYGEVCPFGPMYSSAHPTGTREVLRELAPQLLDENPLHFTRLSDKMDYLLAGHAHVKSTLDMAFWDILGKHTKLPVCDLLGGCYGDTVDLYHGVRRGTSLSHLTSLKQEGYKFFGWKSKGDIQEDISQIRMFADSLDQGDGFLVDCNTVYPQHKASHLAWLTRDVHFYLEQPCSTIAECKLVHQAARIPLILDESIHTVQDLLTIYQENFVSAVKLKISKLGGITRARQARDLCLAMGMPMFIEDVWGTELTFSTAVHLGHSTPSKYRMPSYSFKNYNNIEVWTGGPVEDKGKTCATRTPGLGVTPKHSVLGKPVLEF